MNQFNRISHHNFSALSGSDIVRMMRGTRVTIRQMAEANKITMKRIRELRVNGTGCDLPAWEIFQMLRQAQIAK